MTREGLAVDALLVERQLRHLEPADAGAGGSRGMGP